MFFNEIGNNIAIGNNAQSSNKLLDKHNANHKSLLIPFKSHKRSIVFDFYDNSFDSSSIVARHTFYLKIPNTLFLINYYLDTYLDTYCCVFKSMKIVFLLEEFSDLEKQYFMPSLLGNTHTNGNVCFGEMFDFSSNQRCQWRYDTRIDMVKKMIGDFWRSSFNTQIETFLQEERYTRLNFFKEWHNVTKNNLNVNDFLRSEYYKTSFYKSTLEELKFFWKGKVTIPFEFLTFDKNLFAFAGNMVIIKENGE